MTDDSWDASVDPAPAVPQPPDEDAVAGSAGTGHPAVDAALVQLDAVADRPPAEQVGAYEAAHRTLTDTLSAIDQS